MFKKRSQGIIISAITIFITVGLFALPVSAGTVPLAVCIDSCNLSPSPSDPMLLYWAPYPAEMQPGQGIAWTVFDEGSPVIPTLEIIEYFCMSGPNACDRTIYTENGSNNTAQRAFRCAFYNPLYDSERKTCTDGTCDSLSDVVTTWSVLVPVLSYPDGCPPGNEPYPMIVEHYAEITISDVFASGGGTTGCACEAYNAPASPPGSPNGVIVERIECISCEDFVYGVPFKLPDTGQTESFTTTFGEDSDYSINPPSFTINPDGVTVTDNNTGLMWQREDDGMTYDWYEADMFCDNLSLGGFFNWRLPTKKELLSIADFEYGITLDPTYFSNLRIYCWSSDDFVLNPSHAWVVFGYEGVFPQDKSIPYYYVRCVRGSPLVFNDYEAFVSPCGGIVYDYATGLEWQQYGGPNLSWEDALIYCEELLVDWCGEDWRLPNIKELESLADVTRYGPAIDTAYFPFAGVPTWSSTTCAHVPSFSPNAFYVDFNSGAVHSQNKYISLPFRCVRGKGIYADNDSDGYDSTVDCDDNDPTVNPGMNEIIYNGKDDDCDPATLDDDLDEDGYGIDTDCDDNDPTVNPGVEEVPYNGKDDDCDPATPNDDLDNDGYDSSVDCDDNDSSVNPGMTEIPYNGKDDDCNPATKDDDLDNDGYGIADDCDDNDPAAYPGATEIKYDGIDQDCNGYDLTIDITSAKYGANDSLKVEATSSLGSGANLELVGYGLMRWHHKKLFWVIEADSVGGDPGMVTVCGIEGCDTTPTISGGGKPSNKEGKAKTCSDGLDNDSDGLVDCADPDCSKNKACK